MEMYWREDFEKPKKYTLNETVQEIKKTSEEDSRIIQRIWAKGQLYCW